MSNPVEVIDLDAEKESRGPVNLRKYRHDNMLVNLLELVDEPRNPSRAIYAHHVDTMKAKIGRVGYSSSEVGMVATGLMVVCVKEDHGVQGGQEVIVSEENGYKRVKGRCWLIDGRHRFRALKELVKTDQSWNETLENAFVSVVSHRDGTPVTDMEVLALSRTFNDATHTALRVSFVDSVFTAVSTLHIEAERRNTTADKIRQGVLVNVMEEHNTIGVGTRQLHRYAKLALALAASDEKFELFLSFGDRLRENKFKLGVGHLCESSLLKLELEGFDFCLQVLEHRLVAKVSGDFEAVRKDFYHCAILHWKTLCKAAAKLRVDTDTLLAKRMNLGAGQRYIIPLSEVLYKRLCKFNHRRDQPVDRTIQDLLSEFCGELRKLGADVAPVKDVTDSVEIEETQDAEHEVEIEETQDQSAPGPRSDNTAPAESRQTRSEQSATQSMLRTGRPASHRTKSFEGLDPRLAKLFEQEGAAGARPDDAEKNEEPSPRKDGEDSGGGNGDNGTGSGSGDGSKDGGKGTEVEGQEEKVADKSGEEEEEGVDIGVPEGAESAVTEKEERAEDKRREEDGREKDDEVHAGPANEAEEERVDDDNNIDNDNDGDGDDDDDDDDDEEREEETARAASSSRGTVSRRQTPGRRAKRRRSQIHVESKQPRKKRKKSNTRARKTKASEEESGDGIPSDVRLKLAGLSKVLQALGTEDWDALMVLLGRETLPPKGEIVEENVEEQLNDDKGFGFVDEMPEGLPVGYDEPQPYTGERNPRWAKYAVQLPSRWPKERNPLRNPRPFLEYIHLPHEHRSNVVFRDVDMLKANHHMVYWHAAYKYYEKNGVSIDDEFLPAECGGLKGRNKVWSAAVHRDEVALEYFAEQRTLLMQRGYCILEGFMKDENAPDEVGGFKIEKVWSKGTPLSRVSEHQKKEFPTPEEWDMKMGDRFWYRLANSGDESATQEEDEGRRRIGRYSNTLSDITVCEGNGTHVWLVEERALIDLRIGQALAALRVWDHGMHSSEPMYVPNTGGRWLVSTEGCRRQQLHTDFPTLSAEQLRDGKNPGYFVMCSTTEVVLWVCENSHSAVARAMGEKRQLRGLSCSMKVVPIKIPPYSIFIGRGDMFHAGAAYSDYERGTQAMRYYMYLKPHGSEIGNAMHIESNFSPEFDEDEIENDESVSSTDEVTDEE